MGIIRECDPPVEVEIGGAPDNSQPRALKGGHRGHQKSEEMAREISRVAECRALLIWLLGQAQHIRAHTRTVNDCSPTVKLSQFEYQWISMKFNGLALGLVHST